MKTAKVARSSPSPQPEAPPRPLLPQRWNGKTVFNVAEVAEIFEMNTWVIYDLIRRKQMRAVRIGRLVKVPRHVIEEMLEA
jgi:excisionase family DNA binding protein